MVRRRPEARLEVDILLELGGDPRVALYHNEVGRGYYGNVRPQLVSALEPWPEAKRRALAILQRSRVVYGLGVGSPDLVCIGVGGAFVGGELKSATGRSSPEQIAWATAARARGARVDVWRSIEDARKGLGL